MGDCRLVADGLSRNIARNFLRSVFIVASFVLVFLMYLGARPTVVGASDLYLLWGDFLLNEQIQILDGGIYQVPLGVFKETYVSSDIYSNIQGHLYRIDPITGSRIDLGIIGSNNMAWDRYGKYEVDVYDLGPLILSRQQSLWGQVKSFLFGATAYANAGDLLGTIHFTLEPVQAPNHAPELSLLPDSNGVSPQKGTPNGTTFTFRVVYTDLENTTPASIAVAISGMNDSGAPHTLTPDPHATGTLADGLYSNGEAYSASFKIPTKGEHTFAFITSDGIATTTLQILQAIEVGNSNVAFFPGVEATYLYKSGLVFEDQVWLPTPGFFGSIDYGMLAPAVRLAVSRATRNRKALD